MKLSYRPAQTEEMIPIAQESGKLIEEYESQTPKRLSPALRFAGEKIEKNIGRFRVIWADGEKAGFFYLHQEPDGLWLDGLTVMEAFRNRGIGTRVIRDCILIAVEKGEPLRLSVFSENARAARLFSRLGFAVERQVRGNRYVMRFCDE